MIPGPSNKSLPGEKSHIGTTGIGASVVYDSRDVITDCHKGIYLKIEQGFYPKFLGNKYDFMMTVLFSILTTGYGKAVFSI